MDVLKPREPSGTWRYLKLLWLGVLQDSKPVSSKLHSFSHLKIHLAVIPASSFLCAWCWEKKGTVVPLPLSWLMAEDEHRQRCLLWRKHGFTETWADVSVSRRPCLSSFNSLKTQLPAVGVGLGSGPEAACFAMVPSHYSIHFLAGWQTISWCVTSPSNFIHFLKMGKNEIEDSSSSLHYLPPSGYLRIGATILKRVQKDVPLCL